MTELIGINLLCLKAYCLFYIYYQLLLYSAILHFQADSLCSHVILHEWIAFYSTFLNIHWSGVLTALAWLVPHETAAISAHSVYTIQPCTMSLHASHIRKMYVCLAVTCHLHFWQNDRGLLRATVVTKGWNGYRNVSAQKVDPGEENSPAAPAGNQTHNLSIMSLAL